MSYLVFYISLFAIWVIFGIISRFKPVKFDALLIGIATIGYSMGYDTILGDVMGLYHYINPAVSNLYMTISAFLLYPLLNMIYVLYLPKRSSKRIGYTLLWIIAMFVFELITVLSQTIVFTGWRPLPWSIVTYIATYAFIILFNNYIESQSRIRIY